MSEFKNLFNAGKEALKQTKENVESFAADAKQNHQKNKEESIAKVHQQYDAYIGNCFQFNNQFLKILQIEPISELEVSKIQMPKFQGGAKAVCISVLSADTGLPNSAGINISEAYIKDTGNSDNGLLVQDAKAFSLYNPDYYVPISVADFNDSLLNLCRIFMSMTGDK